MIDCEPSLMSLSRYKNDPRIAAMTELVDVYQRDDLQQYEAILQGHRDVFADPFIAENIDEVTRNIRGRAMLRLVKPYRRFRLQFAADRLGISVSEAREILCVLIIGGRYRAQIDEHLGTVEVEGDRDQARWDSMGRWCGALDALAGRTLQEGDVLLRNTGGPSMPMAGPVGLRMGGHFSDF